MYQTQTSEMGNLIQQYLTSHQFHPPEEVRKQIGVRYLREKEIVIKKGDKIECVFLIVQGQFAVSEMWSNGSIFHFTELVPDDFICELECCQQVNTALFSVSCKHQATLLSVPVSAFRVWLNQDPMIGQMLIYSLTRKLASSAQAASQMPVVSGMVRLARFLIAYYYHYGTEDQFDLTIPLTREELSCNLGLTTRTVNRLIHSLKIQGAISVQRGKIHITPEQLNHLHSLLPDCNHS